MTEKECLNLIEAHHIQVTPILERDEGKVSVIGWQAGFRTILEGSRQNIIKNDAFVFGNTPLNAVRRLMNGERANWRIPFRKGDV